MQRAGGQGRSTKVAGLIAGLVLALCGAPAAAATCHATPGGEATLMRATILTSDAVLAPGEVLIDAGGVIRCVGTNCADQAAGARRIDCPDAILSPGFIDPHEHISFGNVAPVPDDGIRYTHRHNWRKGTDGYKAVESFQPATDPELIAWMELRHLLAGETSIVGGKMARGLARNLDIFEGLEGLETPRATYEVFPLDDATGIQRIGDCDYGPLAASAETVSALHAYIIHLAEGVYDSARNEYRCTTDRTYDTTPLPGGGGTANDILHGNVTVLHGVGLDHAMLAELARRKVVLVWSPRSNLALYGRTLDFADALDLGIPVALGTDWLYSGSMTLVREADCASHYAASAGRLLDGKALWTMMTANGARAVRMEGLLGEIIPGAVADLILVDRSGAAGEDPYTAVVKARVAQMMAIMRGGRILAGDARLVAGLRLAGCEEHDVGGRAKGLCLAGDAGWGYAALKAHADAAGLWPAFFPDKPPIEPTCQSGTAILPSRPAASAVANP